MVAKPIKPEAEVLKSIKGQLQLFCPLVVWVDRLQSGMVRHGSRFIHLCKAGTPDLYAIISHGGGHVLFIECKSDTGRQSFEQKVFQHKIIDMTHVHYIVARNVNDVLTFINDIILAH
jgi:hypothetical protein